MHAPHMSPRSTAASSAQGTIDQPSTAPVVGKPRGRFSALRRRWILLALLLSALLGPVAPAAFARDEAPAAAIAVPNPWTRRMPEGWWLKRHEETLAAPGRNEARIVFIGDSITDSWDVEGAGLKVWQKEYVPMKPLNLGINCDSTQHVLWRLDNGALDGLPNLKVAVIQIGTNNQGINRHEPEDIAKGIEAVCEKVKQKAPQAKILLLAIFPKGFGANKHDVANGLIARLADDERIVFMDINDALIEGEGIADRVGHLNEKGFEIWAEKIRPTIQKLMEKD